MDLKQEFRDMLKRSGWSQAEAARQLGMTPSALSQIVRENSPVRPSPVTLRLFGLLLQRRGRERSRQSPPGYKSGRGEKWEKDLILSLRRISPHIRKPILSVVYALVAAACRVGDGVRPVGRRKGK